MTRHAGTKRNGLTDGAVATAQQAQGSGPGTSTAPGIREMKPTADAIRRRAYEIYLSRKAKGGTGDAHSDWVQAEKELNRK